MQRLQWFVLVGCLLFVPALAQAQASIAGVVRDTSGAVLPGVTVEASSPALIEKARAVTTDDTGHYNIVDLRPGTYSLTFTLTGFRVVKREGIELTGTFAATVNAELTLGSVEETVTVTGEAPTVDVQNTRRSNVISAEVIAALPAARSQYNHGGALARRHGRPRRQHSGRRRYDATCRSRPSRSMAAALSTSG